MIKIRQSDERGNTCFPWMTCKHTFSFGQYYDYKWVNFHRLQSINELWLKPKASFPLHTHRNLIIITLPLQGMLLHFDSISGSSIQYDNSLQVINAGEIITHTEGNASELYPLHYLQLYFDNNSDLTNYHQIIDLNLDLNTFKNISIDDTLQLQIGKFDYNHELEIESFFDHSWLQMLAGEIRLDNQTLTAGCGAGIVTKNKLTIKCIQSSYFLLAHF